MSDEARQTARSAGARQAHQEREGREGNAESELRSLRAQPRAMDIGAQAMGEFEIDLSKGLEETLQPIVQSVERRYLEALLERTRGRIQRAAKIAGISRRTLQRKLAAHEIDKADFRRVESTARSERPISLSRS